MPLYEYELIEGGCKNKVVRREAKLCDWCLELGVPLNPWKWAPKDHDLPNHRR